MQGGTINQDNRHLQKVSTGAKYLEFTVRYHDHMYRARENTTAQCTIKCLPLPRSGNN